MAHFARGSRGHLITPLRQALHLDELQDDSVFDAFDELLEEMVKQFQNARGLTVDGMVDEVLYRQITGRDWPDLFDRAAMVVSRIENHGFFRDPTTADGVTAGYIGFTGASASLLKVLAGIDRGEVVAAFNSRGIEPMERANYDAFLTMRDPSLMKTRIAAAHDLFQQGKKAFLPKWKEFLRDVLKTRTGIESQKRVALEDYFNPSGITAARNHITSEFGRVMVFSSFVQSGGLRVEPPLSNAGTERIRRMEAVLTNALHIKANKDNYEARHIQLAKALGFPNNIPIDPRQWGFDLPDPPPPLRARVLSLPLSSASQFEAMPKLEEAAAAHSVVEERLPTPELNDLWPPQLADLIPLKNKKAEALIERQHKEAMEVLIELDELPLSCLVINATNWSGTILSAHGGTLALSTGVVDLRWSAAGLTLPFSPQMTNGLVILYMPSGIQKRGSFAHRVQKLIATFSGTSPLIVGWIGQVSFPGKNDPHCADAFFTDVKVKMGAGTLSRLIGSTPEAVIQAWGTACNSVFANDARHPNRKLLWRAATTKIDSAPATACAALAPDGRVWRAKETPDVPNGIFMERIP